MTDIFEFWSQIKRGDKIHPADKNVMQRINPQKHGFNIECLPACYSGPIRSAPVVLLFLSPGFDERDLEFADSDQGKDYYYRCWGGREPHVEIGMPGQEWLESRTKKFSDYEIVRQKLAILNIGAYHSKDIKDYASLMALPSSRMSLNWAHDVLFPDAESGKKIVICMRSAAFWGLETGKKYGQALYSPIVTRHGHLANNLDNQELGKIIRNALEA